jgi:hypothetical protein
MSGRMMRKSVLLTFFQNQAQVDLGFQEFLLWLTRIGKTSRED